MKTTSSEKSVVRWHVLYLELEVAKTLISAETVRSAGLVEFWVAPIGSHRSPNGRVPAVRPGPDA
jgi:hypothetical protein